MRHEPYRARKINSNTYVVDMGSPCMAYLLLGEEKALVIDTGMNPANLRAFFETITDLPMEVVNTHGHMDHILCNGFFDKVYMHPAAIEDCNGGKLSATPGPFGQMVPDFEPIPVHEGHVFDLGNRRIEVFETACHSPGDIMLLDRDNRMLFTGDNLEIGQILIFYGDDKIGASVARHLEILKKMEAHYEEFDTICPAHNGSPVDKSILKYVIENDERILSGIEGTAELASSSFPVEFFLPDEKKREYVRCSEWKGTWVIYDIRRISQSERLCKSSDNWQ